MTHDEYETVGFLSSGNLTMEVQFCHINLQYSFHISIAGIEDHVNPIAVMRFNVDEHDVRILFRNLFSDKPKDCRVIAALDEMQSLLDENREFLSRFAEDRQCAENALVYYLEGCSEDTEFDPIGVLRALAAHYIVITNKAETE